MTAAERKQIRRACELLMGDECQLHEAMAILGPMCGLRFPASEVLPTLKAVDLRKVAARPNQLFRVNRKPLDAQGVVLGGKGKVSLR